MRILYVTNLYPPDYDGGFELNAQKIVLGLRMRGHEVDVLTGEWRKGYTGAREQAPGVHRVLRVNEGDDPDRASNEYVAGAKQSRTVVLFTRVREFIKGALWTSRSAAVAPVNEQITRQWLQGRSYDAAYIGGLHWVGTSLTHALVDSGIPCMWHYGDEWLISYLKGWKGRFTGMLYPRRYAREKAVDVRYLVLNSRWLRNRYVERGFDPRNCFVIYRGVEFHLSADVDRTRDYPPVLMLASRITAYKGYWVVIRAAKRLQEMLPDIPWQIAIVGHGSPEILEALKDLAGDLGVGDRIVFKGRLPRSETVALMKRATGFIFSSLYGEPFANTIIEAMASGTPLIGSNVGSIGEVVTDGVNGLLYERFDEQSLAEHMRTILLDAEKSRSLAIAAVERISEAFTMDAVLDRTEEFLSYVARSAPVDELLEFRGADDAMLPRSSSTCLGQG